MGANGNAGGGGDGTTISGHGLQGTKQGLPQLQEHVEHHNNILIQGFAGAKKHCDSDYSIAIAAVYSISCKLPNQPNHSHAPTWILAVVMTVYTSM